MHDEESALLERVQAYDRDAIAEVYDRYSLRIYRYLYSRVGVASLAEDLTATVFVRMLQAVRSSTALPTPFSAWLYRIAHNVAVDEFRRASELELTEVSDVERVEVAEEMTLTLDRVRRALSQLTDVQQMVISLKFFEGMSNREVAEVVGKSPKAVDALQHRGLTKLRRVIEQAET